MMMYVRSANFNAELDSSIGSLAERVDGHSE